LLEPIIVFVECIHLDGGPIRLRGCGIDCHVLVAALEGNSRVTRLKLAPDRAGATSDAEKRVIFRSLAENKSLLVLDLIGCSIIDENWTVLYQSLKGHPTLTNLNLSSPPRAQNVPHDERKTQRVRVPVAMVQENQVLNSIYLDQDERDEQIYAESILPRLETNLYRPRVLGIKKVGIALRRPLLGRALQTDAVRSKYNLLWMFLSGNRDVVLQSDEERKGAATVYASQSPGAKELAYALWDVRAGPPLDGLIHCHLTNARGETRDRPSYIAHYGKNSSC
jgi:hypothetical protein